MKQGSNIQQGEGGEIETDAIQETDKNASVIG